MFNNNKIIVVIPARGGSKGIPRKNVRLINNKPLISYSINLAKSSEYVDDVVVTTDDSEIALISERFGAGVIRRSEELGGDEVSLDPVIYDAVVQKEKLTLDEYDIVITIQPTSPLLSLSTLNTAIEKFDDFSIDSVITVVDDRHLSWGYDEKNQRYFPNYIERKSKQNLPYNFRETGAVIATRRPFVKRESRLGTNIQLIEVSRRESIEIDTYEDLWVAETYLQKKRIAIVVNAYEEIGTAHVYRCLAIASKLVNHDVLFLLDKNHKLGIDIINRYNYPFKEYGGEKELFKILNEYSPQIVINDILNTSYDYIDGLKKKGYFVVNFEDLGSGSEIADIVFDELYEHEIDEENVYSGHKYFILKDEFYFQPLKVVDSDVNNILIAFEGSDSNNFTEKVIDAILSTNYEGRINVILDLAYSGIEDLIAKYELYQSVQIYRNVSDVSNFIYTADIIFTSAGRTPYEICSVGVPTICMCQNERELNHMFANEDNGFINLGSGENVTKQNIIDEFINLINNYELRNEMNQKMLSVDLKNGFENIRPVIQEGYRKFELKR